MESNLNETQKRQLLEKDRASAEKVKKAKTAQKEKASRTAPNLDTHNEEMLDGFCEKHTQKKETIMGWVQKLHQVLMDVKEIQNPSDVKLFDLVGPSVGYRCNLTDILPLMIHVGLEDGKVMVDLTDLGARNLTDEFKEELIQAPWFGYERNNFPKRVRMQNWYRRESMGLRPTL